MKEKKNYTVGMYTIYF